MLKLDSLRFLARPEILKKIAVKILAELAKGRGQLTSHAGIVIRIV